MLAYQLLRPLAYLSIKAPRKWLMDWGLPFIFALLSSALYFFMTPRPQIFLANGTLAQLSGLLQLLPGFYIASLAAVATFQREDLDQYMPEPTPASSAFIKGQWVPIPLTRRRMMSMMFSYLSFVSIVLFIMIVGANFVATWGAAIVPSSYKLAAVIGFIFIFCWIFWNMIIVTLFGLYQLGDRIHQPEQGG
jgi:hypothetical protein